MLHAVSWMLTACIDRDTVCDLPQIRGVLEEVNAYILHTILYLRKKCFIKFIVLQETYILIREFTVCSGEVLALLYFLRNLPCFNHITSVKRISVIVPNSLMHLVIST